MFAEAVGFGKIGLCVVILFLEKPNYSYVVFVGDAMRSWEGVEAGYVTCCSREGAEDVLGKADGVELEVGFEEQVGDVVETPFARLLNWCSV